MAKPDSSLALPFLHQLTDHELLARVHASARGCRQGLAQLLAELGEVDVRGPALLGSYSSLFSFCVERLGFSESSRRGLRASFQSWSSSSRAVEFTSLAFGCWRHISPSRTTAHCWTPLAARPPAESRK